MAIHTRKLRDSRNDLQVAADLLSGSKECCDCGERKPLTDFWKSKKRSAKDGLDVRCRSCYRQRKTMGIKSQRYRDLRSEAQVEVDNKLGSKVCLCCCHRKSHGEYYSNSNKAGKDGLRVNCINCQADLERENLYGIGPDAYHEATHCHACGVDFDTIPTNRKHTDHCHDTGRVRGIICQDCNTTEGRMSVADLRGLIDYMERTEHTDLRNTNED